MSDHADDYGYQEDPIADQEKANAKIASTIAKLSESGMTAKMGFDGTNVICVTSNVTCPQVASEKTVIIARKITTGGLPEYLIEMANDPKHIIRNIMAPADDRDERNPHKMILFPRMKPELRKLVLNWILHAGSLPGMLGPSGPTRTGQIAILPH